MKRARNSKGVKEEGGLPKKHLWLTKIGPIPRKR